jgi:hypothetical protein
MTDPWDRTGVVETYTGVDFDLLAPDPGDIRLPDIAAGLAHSCRFGGQCKAFYSVAHHSLHVSREFSGEQPRLQLIGLFHDAGEAYIGDVPRPLKVEHDAFRRVEGEILDAVWASFGIDPPTADEWERVMAADDRLLAYEANNILEDGGWAEQPPDLEYDLQSEPIDGVHEQFLSRSETLMDRM